MPAHPADLLCRHSGHQGIGFDIAVDDGAGGDKGIFSHGNAADDGAVGAQGGAFFDPGGAVFAFARNGGTRVVDICEDHARAAEDVVFEGYGVIDADVVLHLDVVADHHIVADEDVLAEGAPLANACTAGNVHPVPDAGVVANLCSRVDYCCRVGGVSHGVRDVCQWMLLETRCARAIAVVHLPPNTVRSLLLVWIAYSRLARLGLSPECNRGRRPAKVERISWRCRGCEQ